MLNTTITGKCKLKKEKKTKLFFESSCLLLPLSHTLVILSYQDFIRSEIHHEGESIPPQMNVYFNLK